MGKFLKNFGLAIPLAFGSLLTLFSIVQALEGTKDSWVPSLFLGLIGIPLLFASIILIIKE